MWTVWGTIFYSLSELSFPSGMGTSSDFIIPGLRRRQAGWAKVTIASCLPNNEVFLREGSTTIRLEDRSMEASFPVLPLWDVSWSAASLPLGHHDA